LLFPVEQAARPETVREAANKIDATFFIFIIYSSND
jgi:hypothetical protein